MTLSSILALLAMVPLARRSPSQSSDDKRVAELQARVDDLERELEVARAALRPLPYHQITEDMRQCMMLQSQAQQQQLAQQSQALAAQQFYGQGLGQILGAQAQGNWPYCNCVPGRGGFLRGDN